MTVTVPFLDLAATTREVQPAVVSSWRELLERSAFVGGAAVEQFEAEWSAYCNTAYTVGVANGTDAIHLTLRALGIGPGDEVVVPANTFIATAEAVVLAGATPRFADVSPDTLLLTAETLEASLTPRTRAVIVVHLYGQMANMNSLRAATERRGIPLIEDAAQAHGATWCGQRAGSLGRAGCFSFYPGKNLGAFGDGGAVVTSDPHLAAQVRSLRDHGRATGKHYEHVTLGTNSRLDALQASVLSIKLPYLDAWNHARRRIAARYHAAFRFGPLRMVDVSEHAQPVYHLGVVQVPDRPRAQRLFASLGVETSIHYPTPCHQVVPFRRYADRPLPVVERAAGRILSLPMFPQLTDEQIRRVCAAADVIGNAVPTCEKTDA